MKRVLLTAIALTVASAPALFSQALDSLQVPPPTDTIYAAPESAAQMTAAELADIVMFGQGSDTLVLASRVSDEVLIERLSALNPYFSLPFNKTVRNYMVSYSEKKSQRMRHAMKLADYYFPIFEETFIKYGLPQELKYLAVVESMLNPTATSRAGARGLWQFMFRTGRRYGLTINSYVDERLDVEKSTEAAAQYLSDLYKRLGDWPLAISAYNCGAGNVSKAIARAGGKRDFWSIYPYLPRETRSYMPAFVGMMYACNYAGEYGLGVEEVFVPDQVDTFTVSRNMHLAQIHEVVGVPLEELRYLNPKYYHDIVPGNSGPCTVLIPTAWSLPFIEAGQEAIASHKASEYLSAKVLVDPGATSTSGNATVYRVKNGDTLSHIAQRYGVSVRKLKEWNHLSGDNLHIGQRIYIY